MAARPSPATATAAPATAPEPADDEALDFESYAVETAPALAGGAPATSPAAAAAIPAEGRRRIERINPSASPVAAASRAVRGRGPVNAAAMFQPLETDDAAIPFDRVPYVPSDLRRVGLIAAAMIVLIVIAAIIVSHVIT